MQHEQFKVLSDAEEMRWEVEREMLIWRNSILPLLRLSGASLVIIILLDV